MIDRGVLLRHVRPGPRYTSYPPATEFDEAFGSADALAELRRLAADAPGEPISLYFHIPFCPKLCWYCACNVVVTRHSERGGQYVDTLLEELGLVAGAVGDSRRVSEVSLGGGSPNFLEATQLGRIAEAVRSRFELCDDAELGVELDPRETSEDQVATLAASGFSRLSVGVQDFDPEVEKAINRHQSVEQTSDLIELARRRGFSTVNIDLVYGLPHQRPETFARTMDAVLSMTPSRVALFGYAHVPHLRVHQKLLERSGPVPNAEQRSEILGVGVDALAAAGYVRIGIDHFARPDDALAQAAGSERLHRNFQGYVVKRADYVVACGTTGITDTLGAYWQNCADVNTWASRVKARELPVARGRRLDRDDEIRRYVITRLMCDGQIEGGPVESRFGIQFGQYFGAELEQLAGEDFEELVRVEPGRLVATPVGRQLVRNICMVFDRYQKRARAPGEPPRFSPTL